MIAWLKLRRRRIVILSILILILYVTDVGPHWGPRGSEVTEAMAFAKALKLLAPSAMELIQKEHNIANELKITLEESANVQPDEFKGRFKAYVDRLVEMRNKRQEIQAALRQGMWESRR